MKIIHFSDIHMGGSAEDWLAYFDKRWVGVFNYRFRRKFQHNPYFMRKAVEYIVECRPDLVVCTGDITSTGQPGEFRKALELLEPITNSDIDLVYIPGNHDYYVKRKKCVDAMRSAFETLNKGRLTFDELPVVRRFGSCDLIIVNESFPTNLLSSCGYLRRDASGFIESACRENKEAPRILVGHFPLIEKHPMLRFRHRLWGQKKVLRLLREGSLDLSLCGHVHKPGARIDGRGRGEICSGSVTRNGVIAEIDYDEKNDVFDYRNVDLKAV